MILGKSQRLRKEDGRNRRRSDLLLVVLSCSCFQGGGAAQGQPDCGCRNPQVRPTIQTPHLAAFACTINVILVGVQQIPAVVYARLSCNELLSYGILCCAELTLRGGCCRVFGDQLAEMPFVATRTGFRRAGHCRRLIKVSSSMQNSISSVLL